MSLIKLLIRLLLSTQRKKYGKVLESSRIWAMSPPLFFGVAHLYGAIDRKNSPLTPLFRAFVSVYISRLNGCSFCIDVNSHFVLSRGGDISKLNELNNFEESHSFTDKEKAILNLAHVTTVNDLSKILEARERILKHISVDELVEIAAMIAFQNMSTKFNNIMDVKPQGFCQFN